MVQPLAQSASIAPSVSDGAGASPAITIRPWTRRDRSELARWPAAPISQDWRRIEPTAGPRHSYAIVSNGETVGRITLRDCDEQSARLGIYLRADMLGLGIGTAGLQAFLSSWWSPPIVRLDVAAGNRRAIRCYEKCGFRHVGERRLGYLEMEYQRCTQ